MGLQYQIRVRKASENPRLPPGVVRLNFGEVIVTAKRSTKIYGLGLLLEGKATSFLSWKNDSKVKLQRSSYYFLTKHINLLDNNVPRDAPSLAHSCTNINGDTQPPESNDNLESHWTLKSQKLPPGESSFSFCLKILENDTFPVPFKRELGSISYKLALYVKLNPQKRIIRAFEFPWSCLDDQFEAYMSLCVDNALLATSTSFQVLKERMGTEGKYLRGKLQLLNGDAFIPGQDIHFRLEVGCKHAGRIQNVSLNLIRNLSFYAGSASKSELTSVSFCENRDMSCAWVQEEEIEWEGKLTVPDQAFLSFKTDEKCLEIFYFVQFSVNLVGKGTLQGEIPVKIVSLIRSREQEEGNSMSDFAMNPRQNFIRRQLLLCGDMKSGPPPPYAQAVKMPRSVSAYDALPPAYEDL